MCDHVEVNDPSPDPLGVRDRVGGASSATGRRAVPRCHEEVAGPHDPRHGRLVRVDGRAGEGEARLTAGGLDQPAIAASALSGREVLHVPVEGSDDLERDPDLKRGFGEERVRTLGKGRDGDDISVRGAFGAQECGALGGDEGRGLAIQRSMADDSDSPHHETVRVGLDDVQ